jgi:hypothetical protein
MAISCHADARAVRSTIAATAINSAMVTSRAMVM